MKPTSMPFKFLVGKMETASDNIHVMYVTIQGNINTLKWFDIIKD